MEEHTQSETRFIKAVHIEIMCCLPREASLSVIILEPSLCLPHQAGLVDHLILITADLNPDVNTLRLELQFIKPVKHHQLVYSLGLPDQRSVQLM